MDVGSNPTRGIDYLKIFSTKIYMNETLRSWVQF